MVDTLSQTLDDIAPVIESSIHKKSHFGLKKLNLNDSATSSKSKLNTLEDWSNLANNLSVSSEKEISVKAEESDIFVNSCIKQTKRESPWSFRSESCEIKRKNRSEYKVTWPQYKRLMKKTERSRSTLHGLAAKNYLRSKFSVYENREKLNGKDKLNEFD